MSFDTYHEFEFLAALRRFTEQQPGLHFELWFLSTNSAIDFLEVLNILDRIRSGFFSGVFLAPSASTWSRVRHCSSSGQPPLRSRSEPLGLSGQHPTAQEKVNAANAELEVCCWFMAQALSCSTRSVYALLIFLKISVETQLMAPLQSGRPKK